MAVPGRTSVFVGLVLIALGTGFFKSNISTSVGQLYDEGDRRRYAGFTSFDMGINLGWVLGQTSCGLLSNTPSLGYHC